MAVCRPGCRRSRKWLNDTSTLGAPGCEPVGLFVNASRVFAPANVPVPRSSSALGKDALYPSRPLCFCGEFRLRGGVGFVRNVLALAAYESPRCRVLTTHVQGVPELCAKRPRQQKL